ncbi:unnamed protein product, partial [Vitis vinifera]
MLTSHPKIQPKLKNACNNPSKRDTFLQQLTETNKNQPPENTCLMEYLQRHLSSSRLQETLVNSVEEILCNTHFNFYWFSLTSNTLGCTGKSQRTQFVPLSQFDCNLLLSGILLFDVHSTVFSFACLSIPLQVCFNLIFFLYLLASLKVFLCSITRFVIGLRKLNVLSSNFKHYPFQIFLTRDKCITWTIEWHLYHSLPTLSNFINHLKPWPWNHKFKSFHVEQLDCLKIFIRQYPK